MPEIRVAFVREIDFADLSEYARNRGWVTETRSAHPVPGTSAWDADAHIFLWRLDTGGSVRFVDDEVAEVQYLVIDDENSRSEFVALSRQFQLVSFNECLEGLGSDIENDERERYLRTLGVISPRGFSIAVFEAVCNGLDGDAVPIRTAAISASLHLCWSEFRNPLRRVAERDPDSDNRAIASNVLNILP